MIRQIEPAKARGKLRPEMWEDSNLWVAEYKFDGTRYLMHIGRKSNRFTSRRQSVKGNGFVEKTDNFPHLRDLVLPNLEGTVLDGEICLSLTGTSYDTTQITGSLPERAMELQSKLGYVSYHTFDILYYKNVDIRDKSYEIRKKLLRKIMIDGICYKHMKYVDHIERNKQRYYSEILKMGGEGIILKNIHSQYGDRSMWVKVKKQETWDVVITGFLDPSEMSEKVDGTLSITRYKERGWIGSICISQGELDCGSVSGMDEYTRAEISRNPKKYIGKVIEIEAQQRLASGKFRHPRFVRFRPDKKKEDCTHDES